MTHSGSLLYRSALLALLAGTVMCLGGCVYRIDIQQGNLIETESLDQVEVGMARSAVDFLLGTPTISDPFHADRWDYPYYYKEGRADEDEAVRRWITIYFEGDEVTRIERDIALDPATS